MNVQTGYVAPETKQIRFPGFLAPLLIVLAGVAAYSNSFSVPFVYDDLGSIPENQTIRHLSRIGVVLSPPQGVTVTGRPILNFSLAINYAISGLNVWSYHAFNLLIHILAGLTLFGILRRTLSSTRHLGNGGLSRLAPGAATQIGFAIALLWTLHPLQTESVTYIVQRAESMMGLFYLLTLYCSLRGMYSAAPTRWYVLAVAACTLGMATKEVMVSAPMIVFLYDRTFAAGSFREAWRRRRQFYLGLAGTWVVLALLVASGGGDRNGAFSVGVAASWWAHGLTQFQAVARYLWLSVWPHPLVFEYGEFWVTRPSDILPYAPAVIGVVAFTAIGLRRWPVVGFLGVWFLSILAPTSLLPGTSEMIVEHRMYLALAAVVAWGVVGAYELLGRRSLWVWPVAAAAFCWLTVERNRDYRTEESIWADTVRKSPTDFIAHYNLGHALQTQPGRSREAEGQFRESLRLNPDYADGHDSLGLLLQQQPGRLPDALAEFREAIRLDPRDARAMNNLGLALSGLPGGAPEAVSVLREAERLEPGHDVIHVNLGSALEQLPDRLPEAEAEFREALRINPCAPTLTDLGSLLTRMPGRQAEAIAAYREALRLDPNYARAHDNLGSVLVVLPGRNAEAVREFQEAVRLDPSNSSAHCNLGIALANIPGRMDDAVAELREAVRLGPDRIEPHFNLGIVLGDSPGHRAEAEAQFEEVLRIKPDFDPARQMLEELRGRP